jgi:NAD(P)-dependent dehydrogenase (short-subunit alcohol dehydrogenase family)
MSSVAGRFAAPFLGAYSASKFGFEALSDTLRRELSPFGVKLIIVQPGMIATPIWDKAEDVDFSPYDRTIYAAPARIAVVQNRLVDYLLPPLLPTKLADWLIVHQMRLEGMNKKQ